MCQMEIIINAPYDTEGMIVVTCIKTLRKRRLMTAEQLALKSGVARVSITRYENGKREPRVGEALKIARALGCTVEQLMDDEEGAGEDGI